MAQNGLRVIPPGDEVVEEAASPGEYATTALPGLAGSAICEALVSRRDKYAKLV